MAKIHILKKIIEGVKTAFYPLTIPQAVIDPTSGKSARAELDEKANHGYESNPKTLKSVDDAKADHGYDVEETQKTLKEVDTLATQNAEDITQLAGEVSLLDAVQGAKIKDIENVLSTANLGQSTQVSVSGRKVVSLPKNAANGGMQVKLEGLTAENLVVNGDFRNGTTGWTLPTGGISSVTNGVLTVTTVSQYHGILKSNIGYNGDVCYISAEIKSDVKPSTWQTRKGTSGGNVNLSLDGWVADTWLKSTVRATVPADNNGLGVYFGATTGTISIRNWTVVNLTQIFGAGNEPTKEQCDIIFSDYFEGVKSFVPTGRVRSEGKNLFDKYKHSVSVGARYLDTGSLASISSYTAILSYIPVMPNTTYYDGGERQSSAYVVFYNSEKSIIGVGGNSGSLFTTPVGCAYVRPCFYNLNGRTAENYYIVRGATAVTYESYKETNLYLTAPELRSVPSARDEIRKGLNGYEHVKRILSKTLAADDITSLVAGTNVDYVTIPVSRFSNWIGSSSTGSLGVVTVFDDRFRKEVVPSGSGFDVVGGGGSYAYGSVNFLLIFTKGTFADLAAAKAGLTGITINYKALTPVITPINYGGILNSAESGTVYHEPIIADAGVYGTNMPILLTDYPIASLEEIIKHEGGVDTYLNVATAVIAPDGLSFTHPDLGSGDLVLFTYAFDKESTNGNITATFYDSNVVKIDTVTGKAYKITDVVTNGVLTRTLTEV